MIKVIKADGAEKILNEKTTLKQIASAERKKVLRNGPEWKGWDRIGMVCLSDRTTFETT